MPILLPPVILMKAIPPEHLNDLDLSTTWAAKNNGKDTKITIQFKEPTRLGGLTIIPGYHKNEETYMKNSRPSHIHMEMYGKYTQEEETHQREYSFRLDDALFEPVYLLDMSWEKIRFRPDYYPFPLIERIILSFPEVYPGSVYDDLCISEIILFSSGPNGME